MIHKSRSIICQNLRLLSLGTTQIAFKTGLMIRIAIVVLIVTQTEPTQLIAQSDQGSTGQASQTSQVDWHTGERLDQFNQFAISASWTDAELRDRLVSFATSQKSALFLDRRVDPSQKINIAMNQVSPERFLWAVADLQSIGVCRVGDFYYFGPNKTANSLPTIWRDMTIETERKSRKHQVKWNQKKPIKSGPVLIVKDLLDLLAKENGFTITNPEAIPHDVWSTLELPPTPLDGRVGILLIGFDKWYRRSADGNSIEIIDFEEVKTARFETLATPEPRKVAKSFKSKFRTLKITATSKKLTAIGPPLDVAKFRAALVKSQKVKVTDANKQTFDVTARASRLAFFTKVANQTKKELKFDPRHREKLEEPVELKLKKVTLTQLLDATIKGTDFRYEITDTTIKILKN